MTQNPASEELIRRFYPEKVTIALTPPGVFSGMAKGKSFGFFLGVYRINSGQGRLYYGHMPTPIGGECHRSIAPYPGDRLRFRELSALTDRRRTE